jgi:hypothetical protein
MSEHKHDPVHPIGTCADCGGEMVYNVPRMGPDGGYVHKNTGRYDCGGSQAVGASTGHEETVDKTQRSLIASSRSFIT